MQHGSTGSGPGSTSDSSTSPGSTHDSTHDFNHGSSPGSTHDSNPGSGPGSAGAGATSAAPAADPGPDPAGTGTAGSRIRTAGRVTVTTAALLAVTGVVSTVAESTGSPAPPPSGIMLQARSFSAAPAGPQGGDVLGEAADRQEAAVTAQDEARDRAARAQRAETARRARAAAADRASRARARAARVRAASVERAARDAVRDPRSAARALAGARGWGAGQFSCLDSLWQKESRWDHRARNPSSGAYGIPQSLPGRKMAGAGSDWRTNPATQIRWGLGYIADRYGTPCGAWAHSRAHNWY